MSGKWLIRQIERLPIGEITKRALIESVADHCAERGGGLLATARVIAESSTSWRVNVAPFRNIGQDLRGGLRRLRQSPAFTAFSIVTLALGIGATTAIYAVIQSTLYQPLNIQAPERVMNIYASDFERRAAGWQLQMSLPDFQDIAAQQTTFTGVMAWARLRARLATDGQTAVVFGETVTGNYFDLLGVRAARGRPLQPADDRPEAASVIVLSDDGWHRYFHADAGIVGRVITLEDEPFEVVGVAEPGFRGVDMPAVMPSAGWISLSAARRLARVGRVLPAARDDRSDRDTVWLLAKGRLKPDATQAAAAAELAAIGARLDAAYPRPRADRDPRPARAFSLLPSTRLRMHESIHPIAGVFVGVTMTSLALIVLIAGTNLANLQLGRFAQRRAEIGVRLALGASRWRVVRALAVEGLVLSIGGFVVGLALAVILMRWMTTSIDVVNGIVLDVRPEIGAPALAAALLCTTLSTVVAGLVPAWHATRSIRIAAAGSSGQGVVRWRGRRAVIAVQVAVSIVLLSLASVFGGTALRMIRSNTGIDYDHLVAAQIDVSADREPERLRRAVADLVEGLRRTPGVVAAFAANGLPIGYPVGATRLSLSAEAVVPDSRHGVFVSAFAMDPAGVNGLGLTITRGRALTRADQETNRAVCLIGEGAAARLFDQRDPVGHVVYQHRSVVENGAATERWLELTIVGVVADVDVGAPGDRTRGILVVPFDSSAGQAVIVTARLGNGVPVSASWMRDVVARVDRTLPLVEVRAGPSLLRAETMFSRVGALLTSAMGLLAALLAVAGLSGVLGHMVASRVREIGVRIALGARPRQVVRMVLIDGLKPVCIGILAGIAAAWVATMATGALVARFGGFRPAAGLTILGFMLGAGAIASFLPARRASRVDPNVALREL